MVSMFGNNSTKFPFRVVKANGDKAGAAWFVTSGNPAQGQPFEDFFLRQVDAERDMILHRRHTNRNSPTEAMAPSHWISRGQNSKIPRYTDSGLAILTMTTPSPVSTG